MRALFAIPAVLGLIAAFGCTRPREPCEQVCAWFDNACPEDPGRCVDHCRRSEPAVFAAAEQCASGPQPTTCEAAVCCVGFEHTLYDDMSTCPNSSVPVPIIGYADPPRAPTPIR